MWGKFKKSQTAKLSPHLDKIWGFVKPYHLILATPDFIVWIDEVLDVDWKTTREWDDRNRDEIQRRNSIMGRASVIETADWDSSDWQKTLQLKRHIGEAFARCFHGDFENAEKMLETAESYRASTLKSVRRKQAIHEQITIKDHWKTCHRRWTFIHYAIGCAALLTSTLVAAKPTALGLNDPVIAGIAWLVAFLTGLLTFLTPDKKADKYARAWAILNSQITRYNVDETYTVNDVLDAYQRGQDILFDHSGTTSGRTKRPA